MNTNYLREVLSGAVQLGLALELPEVGWPSQLRAFGLKHADELQPGLCDGGKWEKCEMLYVTAFVLADNKRGLLDVLRGIFTDYPDRSRLQDGCSVTELAAVVGDLPTAFAAMGAGQVVGLWHVITPADLGAPEGDLANDLAMQGFIQIRGFKSSYSEYDLKLKLGAFCQDYDLTVDADALIIEWGETYTGDPANESERVEHLCSLADNWMDCQEELQFKDAGGSDEVEN